jgi:transcription-repair coupling factor (superfamily II helicase)
MLFQHLDESLELIEVVRLRRIAIELGIEKIILKHQKMVCQFISDPQSVYYQSPVFSRILKFVQTNQQICRMKEANHKLSLTFEKVKSIKKAKLILQEILV